VPTGVYLESLQFSGANNVQVSGYVWQRWPLPLPDDIVRGIELPEATSEIDLTEYKHITLDNHDVFL